MTTAPPPAAPPRPAVRTTRPATLAAAFSRGDVGYQYFVNQFAGALSPRTARAELDALAPDQAAAVRDWIDSVKLWDRATGRLWPLCGGAAVEEALVRWRLDLAVAAAAARVRADPAAPQFPALLDVLEGRTELPRPAAEPAAAPAAAPEPAPRPEPVAAAA